MIILASTSPRRRELFAHLNLPFVVKLVEIDERQHETETPCEYIRRMVLSKATQACLDVQTALVITADTIVVADGEILTKPTNKAHAFAMWDKLSDTTHEVWTAVCLSVMKDGQLACQRIIIPSTKVRFIALSDDQKERYWATGEPMDKAGGYAIQGGAMAWAVSIEGSYTNVVGLPLAELSGLIQEGLVHLSQDCEV